MSGRLFALLSVLSFFLLSASSLFAASTTHGYDELNRLKWTQFEDGTVISYDYDKVGNRLTKNTYTSNAQMFSITTTSSGNGTIIPSGTIQVPSGGSQSFLFYPNGPDSLSALSVDGAGVSVASSITLNNVTANHTVSAQFSDITKQPCTNYPARLARATPVDALSLNDAYGQGAFPVFVTS